MPWSRVPPCLDVPNLSYEELLNYVRVLEKAVRDLDGAYKAECEKVRGLELQNEALKIQVNNHA